MEIIEIFSNCANDDHYQPASSELVAKTALLAPGPHLSEQVSYEKGGNEGPKFFERRGISVSWHLDIVVLVYQTFGGGGGQRAVSHHLSGKGKDEKNFFNTKH